MSSPEELAVSLIMSTARMRGHVCLSCIPFLFPYKLLERDAEAVKEWLSGNKSFHLLRDHPWHTALILGGLWGARWGHQGEPARRSLAAVRDAVVQEARGRFKKGADQSLLRVS